MFPCHDVTKIKPSSCTKESCLNVTKTWKLPRLILETCGIGCRRRHIYSVKTHYLTYFEYTARKRALIKDIKNNAWVTVNNYFLSRVRRFGNDFHEWRSHEWKSLPNRLTIDKISLFTVTNVLFYFLHAILCHEHTNPQRTIIERSFRRCCQGRPFLTALWCHHNWSVTSCDREILVLWRHICLLSLHAQIGAKAIFTNE